MSVRILPTDRTGHVLPGTVFTNHSILFFFCFIAIAFSSSLFVLPQRYITVRIETDFLFCLPQTLLSVEGYFLVLYICYASKELKISRTSIKDSSEYFP